MGKLAVRKVEAKRYDAWGYLCGYQRADGSWCRNWAIRGGYCCRFHGGSFPSVRATAQRRLSLLADPALFTLEQLVRDPGVDDAVRLRAIRYVLALNGIRNTRESRSPGEKALPGAQGELKSDTDAEIEALLAKIGQESPESAENAVSEPLALESGEGD